MTLLVPAITAIGDPAKARIVLYANGQLVQAPMGAITLYDTSSVAGNASKFWNPLYYGNAGTGIVHRLNRVLIGEATLNSSDIGPVTRKDWLETLLSSTVSVSQLATVSATGQLGSTGGARTSDYRTIFGAASAGSQGITGIGYNDDTTAATTPIAAGVVGIGIHKTGVNGITLNQFDINSTATTVSTTPFNGVSSGSTWALGLTAGSFGSLATQNATGAMYIGAGTTTKFNKGIISLNGALDTTVGSGGGGVTYEAYRGQSFRWLNSSNTVDAEIWGDAAGLHHPQALVGGTSASGSLTLKSTSGVGTADFINFLVGNNGATEGGRFDTAGRLLLGSTTAYGSLGALFTQFQSHGTAAGAGLSLFNWGNALGGGTFILSKSRSGTVGTRGVVLSGDTLGVVLAAGDDGTNFIEAGEVRILSDGTPGTNSMPGRIQLGTTTSGASTPTERVRIDSNGFVNVLGGSFGIGAPVTKTASFTLATTENSIICNGTATITATLPAASSFSGRVVRIRTIAAFTVVSASSNVVPLAGGAASTAILAATAGKWADLQSDGSNWQIMASN